MWRTHTNFWWLPLWKERGASKQISCLPDSLTPPLLGWQNPVWTGALPSTLGSEVVEGDPGTQDHRCILLGPSQTGWSHYSRQFEEKVHDSISVCWDVKGFSLRDSEKVCSILRWPPRKHSTFLPLEVGVMGKLHLMAGWAQWIQQTDQGSPRN